MTPAIQRLRQTLGANLTPEHADAQAREQAGAKSGPGRDQVTPEVRRMLAAITGEVSRGEIMAKLGLKDESSFESTYRSEEQ